MPNDEGPYSEFYEHAGDNDWFDEGEEVYESILDDLIEDFGEDVMDDYAADLMWNAFFNPDVDIIDRTYARFEFFDYTGIDWDDFDWDAWREWYES